MSKAMEDLARRAVACPAFRPLVGMVGVDGTVILTSAALVETSEIVEWRDFGTMHRDNRECTWAELLASGWLPDFDAPATRGCLLALVREALGHDVWIEPVARQGEPVRWCIYGLAVVWDSGDHDTQAAALVAALESARAAGRS